MFKGHFAATAFIFFGIFILLDNLGVLQFNLMEMITTWWPALLIGIGVALFLTPGNKKKD
jgi:hypothetical protein